MIGCLIGVMQQLLLTQLWPTDGLQLDGLQLIMRSLQLAGCYRIVAAVTMQGPHCIKLVIAVWLVGQLQAL
jgi:hypothetical protein